MKRLGWVLLSAMLLGGCAAQPSAPAPVATTHPKEALCTGSSADLQPAVAAYMADVASYDRLFDKFRSSQELPRCIGAVGLTHDGSEALLVHGSRGHRGMPAVLARRAGSTWDVTPVTGLEGAGPGGLLGSELLLAVTDPDNPDFSRVFHGTLAPAGGAIQMLPVLDAPLMGTADFLRPDEVLLTYDSETPEVLAWTRIPLVTPNHQQLLKWDGGRFVLIGERDFTDPFRTANRFVGALKGGDRALAARYADDPAAVDAAAAALGQAPGEWQPVVDWITDHGEWFMWMSARNSWSLIPASVRAAQPEAPKTWTIRLQRGKAEVRLQLRETEQGWIVTGVE